MVGKPRERRVQLEQRCSEQRKGELGLSDAEIASHDAVVQNDTAVMEFRDDVPKVIARELVKTVRESATIN